MSLEVPLSGPAPSLSQGPPRESFSHAGHTGATGGAMKPPQASLQIYGAKSGLVQLKYATALQIKDTLLLLGRELEGGVLAGEGSIHGREGLKLVGDLVWVV